MNAFPESHLGLVAAELPELLVLLPALPALPAALQQLEAAAQLRLQQRRLERLFLFSSLLQLLLGVKSRRLKP